MHYHSSVCLLDCTNMLFSWHGMNMYRWHVYWRAEWVGWISSRDAVWNDTCQIHINYQRNGSDGNKLSEIILMHLCVLYLFHVVSLVIWCFNDLQLEKYKNYDFGRCPRVYCCGQPCLPVGQSDIPRSSTVKIYCPKCEDIYYPRSKYQGSILMSHQFLY